MAVVLALVAGAAWGASDFLGGLGTRILPLRAVLMVSQLSGLMVILVAVASFGGALPLDSHLLLSLLAGVFAVIELALLYMAIARGPVIIVAPIAATGTVWPVLVGLVRGDRLTATVIAGICLALCGSVLTAVERGGLVPAAKLRDGALLALAASLGVGGFIIPFDLASRASPLWATAGVRVGGCLALLPIVLSACRRHVSSRSHIKWSSPVLAMLIVLGVIDAAADLAFAHAAQRGEIAIVSVLASLYPVATIALGAAVLRDRPRPWQLIGAAIALSGAGLIAAASG